MKNKVLLLIVVCLSGLSHSKGQSIVNSGFETWNTKFYYDDLAIFSSTNPQAYLVGAPIPVKKSMDKVSGQLGLTLETVSTQNDTIPGMLFLGRPGNMSLSGGFPFPGHPDSISVYAKYDLKPNDTASIIIFYKRSGAMIGLSRLQFTGKQSIFKKFRAANFWFNPNNADSIAVIMSSSNLDGTKHPGSSITLDSLNLFNADHSSYAFPNYDFENWFKIQSEEPEGWNSFNYLNTSNPMATKSTDRQSGSYALKIKNVETPFGHIMGFISNGRLLGGDNPEGGMRVNQNPSKVSGYYKYSPVGPDTAIGGLFLYRYDATLKKNVLLEDTLIKFAPASAYTYFEIPLKYDKKPLADTLNISFASTNPDDSTTKAGLGSTLLIDNLNIEYKTNAYKNLAEKTAVSLSPNPFNTSANLFVANASSGSKLEFKLLDMEGKMVERFPILNEHTVIQRNGLARGVYMYQIADTEGKLLFTGRLLID